MILFVGPSYLVYMIFVLQIPELGVAKYASQILSVIVALIEDTEEEVALEAVQGLGKVRFLETMMSVAPYIFLRGDVLEGSRRILCENLLPPCLLKIYVQFLATGLQLKLSYLRLVKLCVDGFVLI